MRIEMNLFGIIIIASFVGHGLCGEDAGCVASLDVIAVVDGSDSIDSDKFSTLKTSLLKMVEDLKLEERNSRFGLIVYSSSVTTIIPFSENQVEVLKQIAAIQQPMEGTQTHLALAQMNKMFAEHARAGAVKVGIILTDGNSKNKAATIAEAYESQKMNINMFAVSTNLEVDISELEAIATLKSRVLTVEELPDICPHLKVLLQQCLETECKDYLDVVTVIDGSDSITRREFLSVKNAVKDFIGELSMENEQSRFAVVMFSSNVSQVFDFTNDKNAMLVDIDSLRQPRDGTNTAAALEKANNLIKDGGREGVPKVLVVITDGYSRNMAETARFADESKTLGINVYSIGISDRMHTGELSNIASNAKQSLVFDHFSQLSRRLMEDVKKACEDMNTNTTTSFPTTSKTGNSDHTTKQSAETPINHGGTTQKYSNNQTTTLPITTKSSMTTKSSATTNKISTSTDGLLTTKNPSSVDPLGLCDKCRMYNGVGFNSHKTSCQKFVECVFDGDMLIQFIIKDCPLGLFWDQDKLTCNFPEEVDCKKDPCFSKPDGDIVNPDNCREYYKCVGGISYEKCCQPKHAFDSFMRTCVPRPACQDACKWGNPETGECSREEFPGDKTLYKQKVEGIGYLTMLCAAGSLYNKEKCQCDDIDEDFSFTIKPQPDARECKPEVYLPFNTGTYDESGNYNFIQNDGVKVDDGTAYFDGQGGLRIPRFSNVDFGKTLVIRLKYKLDGVPTTRQALVTNGDCGVGDTISVVAEQQKTVFSLTSGDGSAKTTTDIESGSDWNEVEYKVSGGVLSTSVNGKNTNKMVNGIIIRRHCGLQIGRGEGLDHFKGWMDEISIYMCSV